MAQEFEWPAKGSSPSSELRWQAIELLTPLLPRPHNFATAMGRGMRKLRLQNELAEYDLLHRLRCGRSVSLDELVCTGTLLISSREDRLAAQILPLEEALLINPVSFEALAKTVADTLHASD